ncbi:MAG TPA: ATP-binding protein [Pseudonocardiaceae bacterium]|nr:ATP-binding protein [Pseudonocardiaceae bacterium]
MPLRLRLAALFSLATAVIIACAAVMFLAQLRDGLYATLDTGLRAQMDATAQELASDGKLPAFRPNDEPTVVERLDGTPVQVSPSAAGLTLSAELRKAALRDAACFTTNVGGERTRVLASTAYLHGMRVLVMVSTGTDVSDDAVERVRTALIVGGPLGVLLVGLGAWLLADAALRPVERMRKEASAIGEHDPDRRLAIPTTRDEIAALGLTMNRLLDRLHTALERERRFVGDASHELRTPLAILRTELELAGRPGRTAEALRSAIAEASEETDRLIKLTEDLLLLARADNHQTILHLTSIQLSELMAAAVRRGRGRDHQPPIEVACPENLRFVADRDRMLQLLENLITNAVVHTPPRTAVQVGAYQSQDGHLTIQVLDEGPGLPPDFQPRAFDRFHRAEDARSRDTGGTGLGLSIVRAIAEAHGGTADINNRTEGGACATVVLPPGQAADVALDRERIEVSR